MTPTHYQFTVDLYVDRAPLEEFEAGEALRADMQRRIQAIVDDPQYTHLQGILRCKRSADRVDQ
jgi:hypothetical protein